MGHSYAEYGRKQEAQNHITRYSRLVPKETAQYIAVCETACYVEWMLGNFEQAVLWGKEGVRIKNETNIDTKYDSSHELALALRDLGDVNTAMKYFLKGKDPEVMINEIANTPPDEDEEDNESTSALLGNVGRCLQFQGNVDLALRFYLKSASILNKEETALAIMNRGYAALWIGEALEIQRDYNGAYIAYRYSENIWSKRAPLRANDPAKRAAYVAKYVSDPCVLSLTETGIERDYKKHFNEKQ